MNAITENAVTQFARLPIGALRASATAVQALRRKHFSEAGLKELADSIKTQGLLQPVLVRPKDDTVGYESHEIIAGERRWMAAMMAGLQQIDCHIRPLTDAQVIEAQLVENLQRADISALEEAEGYKELMAASGINADQLAARVGKSRATIYARLKLLDLAPAARKALEDGKIDASVALLIARIPDADMQTKAAAGCADADVAEQEDGFYGGTNGQPLTHEQAEEYINETFMVRVEGNAAIAKARAAGEIVIDGKDAAKLWKNEYGQPAGYIQLDRPHHFDRQNKPISYAQALGGVPAGAVLIQNPHTGEAVHAMKRADLVAALKAKKLELPYELREREAPTRDKDEPEDRAAQREKEAAEQAKREREQRLAAEILAATAKAVRAKYPARLGKLELIDICRELSYGDEPDEELAPPPASLEKATEKELTARVIDFLIFGVDRLNLQAAAKRYGVNAAKIKTDVTAAFKAREKEAAGGTAKAGKKTAKK